MTPLLLFGWCLGAGRGHWGEPSAGSPPHARLPRCAEAAADFRPRAGTLIKSSNGDKLKRKHSITGRIEMDAAIVLANIRDLAVQFASERHERQQRRRLDSADFDRLCEAGFQLTGVPIEYGGIWESIPRSTRPICDMLRVLAHGDASIAMVCAMHPSVLNFWMATPEVPTPFQQAWEAQRRVIFRGVCGGAWWGTIASEPG